MADIPDPETAVRSAIGHWSRLPDLAEFAVRQHGFGDTDGGFGVTYPCDLDAYDRESGRFIPAGRSRCMVFGVHQMVMSCLWIRRCISRISQLS